MFQQFSAIIGYHAIIIHSPLNHEHVFHLIGARQSPRTTDGRMKNWLPL